MLKQICLFMVVCALAVLGGAEQNIGAQHTDERAQFAQCIADTVDQNI